MTMLPPQPPRFVPAPPYIYRRRARLDAGVLAAVGAMLALLFLFAIVALLR